MTLAFNTIGWKSENVLFSAIDALLGDSLLAGAFSGENPSNATATMLDTVVNASGELTVSAAGRRHHHLDDQQHEHGIDEWRQGSGSTTGPKGGQNLVLGFVLASNKVAAVPRPASTSTPATCPASTIQAGGGVSVTAQDSSAISATITLGSSSTAPGGRQQPAAGTGVAGAVSLNDVQGGATASITSTTLSTTGGNVLVQAKEMATLTATTTSEVSAGSSSTPTTTAGSTTKSPLAIDGLIGTNLVQSAASATLNSSHVTTTGTGTGAGGVTVDAENTAT